MELYLDNKYHTAFLIKKTGYNYLSEAYQSYVYPKSNPSLLFMVQQDPIAKTGYSDTYPKVFWESDSARHLKAKIKNLFPHLDAPTLKALQLVERGEFYSPGLLTYNDLSLSRLACSITINIPLKWESLNNTVELKKMELLKQYLISIHFPVLIEVRYYEKEIRVNEKVFFITEDGQIIES